jgi:hypothetical protein
MISLLRVRVTLLFFLEKPVAHEYAIFVCTILYVQQGKKIKEAGRVIYVRQLLSVRNHKL